MRFAAILAHRHGIWHGFTQHVLPCFTTCFAFTAQAKWHLVAEGEAWPGHFMVTFELDLKDEEGLHSGDVRPVRRVEEDSEPGDGYLCPSCPFPWWALHYPSGRVFHRKGRTLFDPPHGQPKFHDRSLKSFMDQILYRGHKPLRSGFFYNEESGAIFGEESAMEHLAQQLHLMDEGQERFKDVQSFWLTSFPHCLV